MSFSCAQMCSCRFSKKPQLWQVPGLRLPRGMQSLPHPGPSLDTGICQCAGLLSAVTVTLGGGALSCQSRTTAAGRVVPEVSWEL